MFTKKGSSSMFKGGRRHANGVVRLFRNAGFSKAFSRGIETKEFVEEPWLF